MNFTVGSVIIIGRWVPKELQSKIDQLIGVDQVFDPSKVGVAEEMVRDEIIEGESNFAIRVLGSTSVLFITSDVCPVADSSGKKKVRVVIHPYYLRIDLYNIGNNILPIPRTAKPTFYKHVPTIILATAPFIGLTNDRRFGTAAFIKTSTDLLHIPGLNRSGASKKNRLDLAVDVRRSFNNPFYNASGSLQLIHPVYTDTTVGWAFGVIYSKSLLPLGISDYDRGLMKIFGSINGNSKISFLSKYIISGNVQFSQNNYTSINKIQNPETDFELSAFCDGRVAKGLTRIGVWFNTNVPKNNINLNSYQRIAGKFGYAVTLGSGHNNVDVETVAAFGYTWRNQPAYSEFFAGNSASDFLSFPLQSFTGMAFPEGLIIRSLREKEGGLSSALNSVTGGTSYWGLNVNFSIPISKWASPLIPDIVIQEEPRRLTIRSAIKGQITTAKSFIANDLALNQNLSDDEADAAAERIVDKDIRPTINYLADRANIYSIKPLVLFDVGQITKRSEGDRMWAACGTGLQMNIVNARLDIGYMKTLFPKSDASKGNFLLRFSVQNFY